MDGDMFFGKNEESPLAYFEIVEVGDFKYCENVYRGVVNH